MWRYERFPYQRSIFRVFAKNGLQHINDFFISHRQILKNAESDPFLNYCKFVISGNNLEIYKHIVQAESLVRFLSGTAMSLVISILIWIFISLALILRGSLTSLVGVFIVTVSFVLLWLIVVRFKHQRRREVMFVWFGSYLILTGGVPNIGDRSLTEIRRSVFGD